MNEPFSATVRVLERHKIRLPKDIFSQIPALAEKPPATLRSVAVPGPFGGIQILPGESWSTPARTRVLEQIKSAQATADAADKHWMLLARYFSNMWPVTLSFYGNRYTLVLPDTPRHLGLVPRNEGEYALVFACGAVLEVWRPDAWLALAADTRSKLTQVEEDLTDS